MHTACMEPAAPLRPSSCHPPPSSCYPSCQVEALASGVRNATLAGYLVRARADADTIEARAGFTGRRDAVIAVGPQVGAVSGGRLYRRYRPSVGVTVASLPAAHVHGWCSAAWCWSTHAARTPPNACRTSSAPSSAPDICP